jgi:hypothetical protein
MRIRFTVEHKGEGWVVRQGPQVLGQFDTKAPAVKSGVLHGHMTPHSQLIIKKENGEFQEERTYGQDPFPPRG